MCTPRNLDSLDMDLADAFEGRTWEQVLQRIADRAKDQAQHIRSRDQGGDDWSGVPALEHLTEKLGTLARYCGYRDL